MGHGNVVRLAGQRYAKEKLINRPEKPFFGHNLDMHIGKSDKIFRLLQAK